MSYIGSKPADAVLETDDIADGVVTSAKIADGTITTADLSFTPVSNPFRNIIINGDMSIAQRGTSATGIGNGDAGYHTVDRYKFSESGSPTAEFTMSQSTDAPSGQGFANSLKFDVTTADTSLDSGHRYQVAQHIEAQNLQYLKWGTSSATSLTLSFWVKSNKTGTYCVGMVHGDASAISYVKEYTVSTSNTWEKITLTFPGYTPTNFNNDNGVGIYLGWSLGAGSNFHSTANQWTGSFEYSTANQVNLADSTSNEWYITGVQLEAGTTASDFEFLPYDVNLQRCLRYFAKFEAGSGENYALGITNNDNLNSTTTIPFSVRMRIAPTSITQTGTASDYRIRTYSSDTCTGVPSLNSSTENSVEVTFVNSGHGFGSGVIIKAQGNSSSSFIGVNAEL